jgi:hypothetical protein
MISQALGDLLSGGLFLEILPLRTVVLELLERDTSPTRFPLRPLYYQCLSIRGVSGMSIHKACILVHVDFLIYVRTLLTFHELNILHLSDTMYKSILFRVQHAYDYIFVISRPWPAPKVRCLRVLRLIESIINDYFSGTIPRCAAAAVPVQSNLRLSNSLGEDT